MSIVGSFGGLGLLDTLRNWFPEGISIGSSWVKLSRGARRSEVGDKIRSAIRSSFLFRMLRRRIEVSAIEGA